MRLLLSLVFVATIAAPVSAIVVDGTKDAQYGTALAVQTVDSEFAGSEWNAAYAVLSEGRLNLMLTGNLNSSFDRLEIFIDSKAGGQSVFDSSGNDNAAAMDGLVFDPSFTADFHIIARRGNDGGPKFNLDFADLGNQSASGYFDVLVGGLEGAGSTGTGVNASPISVAYDGSNVAGIGTGTGNANQAAALAVTTGLELSIALSDLDFVGGPLKIMVGQNNIGHNYWSNQFLGGLPQNMMNGVAMGTQRLGGDGVAGFNGSGAIDFAGIADDQFFVVVPEPTTALLIGLAGFSLAVLTRRRGTGHSSDQGR